MTAPVIVIGAGACGMTAALAARDAGASVVVLERDSAPTGSTAMSGAMIPAPDTSSFSNRAVLKVAEYTESQLAHMIVTENSEILDTGAEFESAMATVVSGLRDDKKKLR